MTNLSELAEKFERLWSDECAPDLETYLSSATELTAEQLSRLVRIDQAQRWQRGDLCSAEEYLNRYPILQSDQGSAVDVIYHEFLLREKHSGPPSPAEFTSRFPHYAEALAAQISFHCALASAAIHMPEGEDVDPPKPVSRDPHESHASVVAAPTVNSSSANVERSIGRYELLAKVGIGSFGTVYKAHDSVLDRFVAIKIPRDSDLTSRNEMERFLREARSAAQLRHPTIVAIHEIDRWKHLPYLVSEYVEGTTLAELLMSRRLVPRETAELVATLADALHYAHEMGVVHRDIKPANIMIDEKGRPRLMDFGLARRAAVDATMTIDGQLLGTPAYMSPEQARGVSRNVDGRSDIYSLGAILYEMLAGELPFRGTTQTLLHQLLHEEPPRPRSLNQAIPRDLETICLKAMAKEASRRYATARDLADDLRRYLRGEPIQARRIGGIERVWRWCRRRPALSSLTFVVTVLLVAIALGGNAVVNLLLAAIATGGAIAAVQYRRQAQKEMQLRSEAMENLYFHRIALAHRDLTASRPHPGRAEELLDACLSEHRNWEWGYLKRLWRTEPIILRAYGSQEFRGIAFSHDERFLAAACGDGTIRVWDRQSGEIASLSKHDSYVYSVAFSPVDSNRIVSSGNDGWIRVWDLESRREALPPLAGLQVYAVGMACCVTFSPDGRLIAATSEAGIVRVWDAATGEQIHQLAGHEMWAACVAFSPDGRFLASGSWKGIVRIWDPQTGSLLRQLHLPEHRYPVSSLAFSPGAARQYLAAGYFDNRVDVWDLANHAIHRQLRGHAGFITSVSFHPEDARRLVSAGEDRALQVWDLPTGRAVLQLSGHVDNCSGLAFSPSGHLLASASYDHTIRLWDATPLATLAGPELRTFHFGHEVWSVAISPDGTRIAAAGLGPNIQIWDTETGIPVRSFPDSFRAVVFSLAFSPDGRLLATAGIDDGEPACVLKVLNVQTGQSVFEHREGQEIFAVAFNPDSRSLAFGVGDGAIKFANFDSGCRVLTVGKHSRPIAYSAVRFQHEGCYLASASLDGTARIWDLTSVKSAIDGGENSYASLPSDHLCCQMAAGNPGVAMWSISFSPDGRSVITGDKDGQLICWDAVTGKELLRRTEAARGTSLSVAHSPNGKWIASASEDCKARVYDAHTFELVRSFRGHLGPIHCLAASNDFIVTGGKDKTVRVWDLEQAKSEPASYSF